MAHLLERGSLVFVSMILANQFDTTAFATYSYFQITVSMLAGYASMGLGVTASIFFTESTHNQTEETPPLGTLWLLTIIIGVFMAVAIQILPSKWIASGLDIPSWMISFGVVSLSFGVMAGAGIVGLERFREAAFASAISSSIVIGGALLAGRAKSPEMAMGFLILSGFINVVIVYYFVIKRIGLSVIIKSMRFNKNELARIFSLAGPMAIVTLASSSATWVLGKILLTRPSGEYQFALFSIGLQLLSLALYLPGIINKVTFPRLIKSRFEEISSDRSSTMNLMKITTKYTGISSLLACCIIFLSAPWITVFWGDRYGQDTWILASFSLVALPMAISQAIGNGIVANSGHNVWLLITLLWFIVLIGFGLFFNDYGARGAAASYGMSSMLMALMAYTVAKKRGLLK